MNNLFNVDATTPVTTEVNEQAANEFRPSYKKGTGGVYEAYIRFLPNPLNPADGSIVFKYSVKLKNFATNQERWLDCPSTKGQPDIIQDTFFLLRKGTPMQQEASKAFSRGARYASLVQVISCISDPTLNGKVLVWSYGKKVHDKIDGEMHPSNSMIKARNPFNMLQGRPFYVKCKQVSGYNNFDESNFFDSDQVNVMVPYNNTYLPVTMENIQNPDFAQTVNKWLNEVAPSLEPYSYHEWTDDDRQFVTDAINAAMNPNLVVTASAPAQTTSFGNQFVNPQQPAGMPMGGGFNGGMNMGNPGMGMGSMPGMTMPTGTPATAPASNFGAMPVQQQVPTQMPNPGMNVPGMGANFNPAPVNPVAPTPQPIQPMSQPAQPSPAPVGGFSGTTPGGFASSNIPEDILNLGATPTSSSAPTTQGVNVNDIVGELFN